MSKVVLKNGINLEMGLVFFFKYNKNIDPVW